MVGSIGGAYGVDIGDLGLPNAFGFSSADPQGTLNTLLQFSGEEASSQGRYATETADRNLGNIGRRLSAIRQGARGASGLSFNVNDTDLIAAARNGENPQGVPLIGGAAGDSGNGELGWGWFGSATYGFGDRDATVREDEYEYDSFGFTVGVDYVFNNNWVLGGTIGIDNTDIDFDAGNQLISQNSGGGLEADGFSVSGFAMYTGEVYVSAILSWASYDYDLERVAVFTPVSTPGVQVNRSFDGDTDGDQIGGEVTVGKVFGDGPLTFDLYGSVDFLNLEIDGFTEDDLTAGSGLALSYGDQDIDSVQSVIGGTLRRTWNTDVAVIIPYLGVEWHHEFDNDSRVVDSRYALALPGVNPAGFLTPTDDPDEDYGEVTLGISAQMQNSLFLYLQWETAVGLEDTNANLITLGVRGIF